MGLHPSADKRLTPLEFVLSFKRRPAATSQWRLSPDVETRRVTSSTVSSPVLNSRGQSFQENVWRRKKRWPSTDQIPSWENLNSILENWGSCSVLQTVSYFKATGGEAPLHAIPFVKGNGCEPLHLNILSMQTFTSSARVHPGQRLQKDVQIPWTIGIQPYQILLEIIKLSAEPWKCWGFKSI